MNAKWLCFSDSDYENRIRKLPCFVCDQTPVDCHHMYNARRNAYLSTPLCRKHHREYHDVGWKEFETRYNVDLDHLIIRLLCEYVEHLKGMNT